MQCVLHEDLPLEVAIAATATIQQAMAVNPYRAGKPLNEPLDGYHSARRGTYRINVTMRAVEVYLDPAPPAALRVSMRPLYPARYRVCGRGMRTSEAAATAGVNVQTLRYYERRRRLLPAPARRQPSGF